MQISQSSLDAIYYVFDLRYQSAYLETPTYYQDFTTTIPSTGRETRFAWVDRVPRLREWVGERQIVNIGTRAYILPNKDFELTLELERNVILDDQVGVYSQAVDMLGMQAKLWPDQLMVSALQNGAASTNLCHDGQPFFSANHPTDLDNPASAVQSNLFTPAGSGANALNFANYFSVRAAMYAYKALDNRPIGVMPSRLIVPPALEGAARQILNADFIAPATAFGANASGGFQTNILKGTADLTVHTYLAGQDTVWYLIDGKKGVKPFVFSQRQSPQFVFKNNPFDPNLFYKKKFIYGVDSRGNAGYSLWFFAAQCSP